MRFAIDLSSRGTCDRAYVGCVITKDNRVISTGYNGSLPGQPHCNEKGHLLVNNHCVRTTHAEMNALMFAAKEGISLKNSEIYITHSPCVLCTKLIIMSGIKKIYYNKEYKIDENPFINLIEIEKIENE